MSLVVNHNLMAANVARNLNSHYANLSNSTQRLSTGLRVNSAADDAAGLAIRELQRADIAALQQGARNANDAISLIQVADGALSIIDEKLVRMKELAEQAATGTYDSTQRLMIESEYQAMASEITRIANATDFNGIHLLDGTLESDKHDGSGLTATGKLKVHFGTGNDSAEDYYYIKIGESTAQAFGLGDASTWEDATNRIAKTFKESLTASVDALLLNSDYSDEVKEQVRVAAENWDDEFVSNIQNFSNFNSSESLSKLYASFKDDEEVSELNTLFQQYIDNYDSINDRDEQKLKYALGRAAMRSLASYPDVVTGFGDTTNAYQITSNTTGLIGNVNYSAFTTSANGSTITYAPGRGSLVFMPPVDYDSITYNAITGVNAPIEYPMSFTSPALSGKDSITNVVPGGNAGESYSYNLDGSLLSYTNSDGTTLYNGSKISGFMNGDGVATFNSDEFAISYLDTDGNRTIMKGNADSSDNILLEYYNASTSAKTTFHSNGSVASYTDNETNLTNFDDSGEASSYTDKSGNTTIFDAANATITQYIDASGNKTDITGSAGSEVASVYTDTSGNITSLVDDGSGSGSYSYVQYQDSNKNITEWDNGTGSPLVKKFTDASGNVVLLEDYGNFNSDSATVQDVYGRKIDPVENAEEWNRIVTNAQTLSTAAGLKAQAAADAASTAVSSAQSHYAAAIGDPDNAKTLAEADLASAEAARDLAQDAFDTAETYVNATSQMIQDDKSFDDTELSSIISAVKATLGSALSAAASSAEQYDYAGYTIATQEDAQKALTAISDAIEAKDKIRADLGAKQNRLENTISNLNIQAENLQAAESRISDVDVSTEMTEFVRQQILTQSAVAMLSQANSLPQMAMQLIGG